MGVIAMTLDVRRRRDRNRCQQLMVYLDGKPCPDAYYADGRRGVVREFVRDSKDQPMFTPDRTVMTQERRGRVKWVRV
jgi:hypothetical protein